MRKIALLIVLSLAAAVGVTAQRTLATAPRAARSADGYLAIPDSFPPRFAGEDFAPLFRRLYVAKGEFETLAEYNTRRATALDTLWHAAMISPSCDNLELKYDADAQVVWATLNPMPLGIVRPDLTSVYDDHAKGLCLNVFGARTSRSVGQNTYGASVVMTTSHDTSNGLRSAPARGDAFQNFPLSRESAESAMPFIRGVLLFRLTNFGDPFGLADARIETPAIATVARPREIIRYARYLSATDVHLALIDIRTGHVLAVHLPKIGAW